MNKSEIKELVNSEVKKVLKDILKDEIIKVYKTKENKDIFKDVVRDAMVNFYKYLWAQRSTWENKL
jgi:hypothetical protein